MLGNERRLKNGRNYADGSISNKSLRMQAAVATDGDPPNLSDLRLIKINGENANVRF